MALLTECASHWFDAGYKDGTPDGVRESCSAWRAIKVALLTECASLVLLGEL
jgi:hypothetical protein